MTPTAPSNVVPTMLALALGTKQPLAPVVNWARVFAAVRAERLVTLAWARSRTLIECSAPPSIVAAWRAQVVAIDLHAEEQWHALHALLTALDARGVESLVLKGLPMAQCLYGMMSARQCSDIDLFVPADQRAGAGRVLRENGWMHWGGNAPFDESYHRESGYGARFLEMHSILPGEALSHCAIDPLPASTTQLRGVTVRVMRDVALPSYLAANIAKHGTPPLLSFLDILEMWGRLDAGVRRLSLALADRVGLSRCVTWALERAMALSAAAEGNEDALRKLGVRNDQRTSVHGLLRLTLLADTPRDAARILGTWTWPRSLRARKRGLAAFWWRRLTRSFRQRFVYTRHYAS